MRSGTSFFDWTVYKKTIARFWPLWAAYFVLWLIFLPLQGLTFLRMNAYQLNEYRYVEEFANLGVTSTVTTAWTLALVFGGLAAMAVLSHLYNARSANLFGSLPVRREGLFVSHYLAGLSFLIVPNAAIFLLTLIVEAVGGYVSIHGLLFWLGVTCGECFLFYSMAVFCGMFTGHILALPAFYAVLNLFAYGAMGLLYMVMNSFYYGFAGFSDWVDRLVEWLTPMIALDNNIGSYWGWADEAARLSGGERVLTTYGLEVVGIYVLVAAVLTVCAFFLYRARRLESAGDVVSVRAMRPVFKYGVAICVGMVFGVGTTWVLGMGTGEAVLMAAILIWGVIGYFAAQMLLDKSFRVLKKWKGAAVIAAVFIVLFCVVGFDLTGFETRIPDPAGVASVDVGRINAVFLGDDGDHFQEEITDQSLIELVNILHREAVEQRDEEWKTQAQIGGTSISLDLTYKLKSGGSLTRRYMVWINPDEVDWEGTAAWAVQQLYDNRELYWQVYQFDQLEECLAGGGRLEYGRREVYDERGRLLEDVSFYGSDAAALLAAVKEDFFAGRIGVRELANKEYWYSAHPENYLTFYAYAEGEQESWYIRIAIQDTATSTLAALEEMADRGVRPGETYSGYSE